MFEQKIFINSSEVDQYKNLKVSSFFKLFQDIAVLDCEQLGFGQNFTIKNNLMWVITRVFVNFIRMPKYQETVVFKTYAGKTMRIIYPRYLEVRSLDGELLIQMSTSWALINAEKRGISLNSYDIPHHKFDNELPIPKKMNLEQGNLKASHIITYTDCDLNLHLNNTRYIDYIIDIFDSSFYKNNIVSSIQIDYQNEVKEKETLDLYTDYNDDTLKVVGKVNNKTSFEAKIDFKKIDEDLV